MDENVGCPYHNHSRVLANPYWIFECRYFEVKLCRESDMKQHKKICETNSLIKNDKVIGCHHPYCKEKLILCLPIPSLYSYTDTCQQIHTGS